MKQMANIVLVCGCQDRVKMRDLDLLDIEELFCGKPNHCKRNKLYLNQKGTNI